MQRIKISKSKDKRSVLSLGSKLKEQVQKTAESSAMATALISSIGEGLIIVNDYGYVNHVNEAALNILGIEQQDLIGKWFPASMEIYDKSGRVIPDYERPVVKALLQGKPINQIIVYKRKDGSKVSLSVTASPLLVKNKPRGAITIFRDISREVQLEEAKDEFVSMASHQLRSPLTSIRLFTELLAGSADKKLSAKEKDYISKINFSTDRLINLVTDLLNISRIELGQLRFNLRLTDLAELVKVRVAEIMPLASSRGIKLSLKNNLPDGEKVIIDRDFIGQAVHNLLSNAIRYSAYIDNKHPEVSVKLTKGRKFYKIDVSDNGIGIPISDRTKIFERFYRADNAVRVESQGTGLGLYLVKQIIEATGGQISYQSREFKGTTFTICLPIKSA